MFFDYEHAVTAPFRMQPGLRKLVAGQPQFTPNRPQAHHLREKLAVLWGHADAALLSEAGFDPRPALRVAMAQAATEHPDALVWDACGLLRACWLGWAATEDGTVTALPGAVPEVGLCLAALPSAWRQAALFALAVQEDLAIVDGQRATLPWLAVALPSHWAPAEKIGRHFAQVHAPVADNAVLVAAGEHLLKLVTGPQRWERFVWNVTRHPRLDAHPQRMVPSPWPAGQDDAALTRQTWFRTERQTFIPLPAHGQAVFTIQVDVRPLALAVDTPDRARRLHDAVASMSAAVLDYRQLSDAREPLLRWLARRAELPTAGSESA